MVRQNPEFQKILEAADKLTDDDRRSLAIELLRPRRKVTRQPTLHKALGLLRGEGPAPTDEEVEKWMDEHRTSKYGK